MDHFLPYGMIVMMEEIGYSNTILLMEAYMISSRMTQKHQATIPAPIRKLLDLHGGDLVGFEIHDKEVIIRKVTTLDLEFAKALEGTVTEWESEEDDKLYSDL